MSGPRRFVIVPLLLLASCLEVESTEVRVVADTQNDRLDVMIVSRGVSSSAGSEQSLRKDLADLRQCRDGACVIAPGLGVMDFGKPEEPADEAEAEARRRLVSFLDFEPGAFFVDDAGRLSFYQFVRIHRLGEFEAFCNERVRTAVLAKRKGVSPATAALIEKAQREGATWLTIDGAGFAVRRPLSAADHRAERDEMWREVVHQVVASARSRPDDPVHEVVAYTVERGVVQALRDNDVAVVRHEDATEYYVGIQGSAVGDYRIRGGEYKDDLLLALAAEEPRPPVVTQELVEKQFAGFRAREARLPAAYAEIKRRSMPPEGR